MLCCWILIWNLHTFFSFELCFYKNIHYRFFVVSSYMDFCPNIYIYVSYFSRIKYFFKNTRIETNTKIYYLCFFYIETESVWFQFVSKPNSAAGNVLLHCFGDCIEEELLSSSNFCCFSKHHMSSQNIICSQLSFSICNCMNHWIRAIWRYQIIVMIRRNNTLSG